MCLNVSVFVYVQSLVHMHIYIYVYICAYNGMHLYIYTHISTVYYWEWVRQRKRVWKGKRGWRRCGKRIVTIRMISFSLDQGVLTEWIPLSLSWSIPISYHTWYVLMRASSFHIEVMNIYFCWSANTGVFNLSIY